MIAIAVTGFTSTESNEINSRRRQDSKLILDVSLPLAQFTNGFEITFQHIGGYVVSGKSEPYIALKDGDIFRVPREGMPNLQQGRGDLFLRFHDSTEIGHSARIHGNRIEFVSEMPCETQVKYVTAEKVHDIPEDDNNGQCAQQ